MNRDLEGLVSWALGHAGGRAGRAHWSWTRKREVGTKGLSGQGVMLVQSHVATLNRFEL